MRRHDKRVRGLSPVMIRSLGVVAIALIAMTTSPENSTAVPNCSQCHEFAHTICPTRCEWRHEVPCVPHNVSRFCRESCTYVWICAGSDCVDEERSPGERVVCTLVLEQ